MAAIHWMLHTFASAENNLITDLKLRLYVVTVALELLGTNLEDAVIPTRMYLSKRLSRMILGSSPILEIYGSLRDTIDSFIDGSHPIYELIKGSDVEGMQELLRDNSSELWECGFKHFYSTSEARMDLIKNLLSKKELNEWNESQCRTVLQLLQEDERFLFVSTIPGTGACPTDVSC